MTASILWTAFLVLAALFLLAVIVKGLTRMGRRQPRRSAHPYREGAHGDDPADRR